MWNQIAAFSLLSVVLSACAVAPDGSAAEDVAEDQTDESALVGRERLILRPDNGRSFSNKVDDTIYVRLAEPATKDAHWSLKSSEGVFSTEQLGGTMPGCVRLFPGCAFTRQWVLKLPEQASGLRIKLSFELRADDAPANARPLETFETTLKVAGVPAARCGSATTRSCGTGKVCAASTLRGNVPGYCIARR